ncbi:Emopamil binding protein-domain-containing protein [Fimicolochytrium jonesii]|uniref:Emopamil binding protein-domain-containing protein n=1 Tax=Fimicolochytrium jonesii TaxID=1396493 RepID=UPI0022FE90A5|nr:Emopamil binding protein-domain-containing protein [Fimicolochytrium jonesii]KAI8821011.1 Emopamil binding protein-domain-containing protein [Fimicolochytrium jonesii]
MTTSFLNGTAAGLHIPHPYFPQSLHLPHYTSPTMTMATILTYFFSTVAVILGISYALISSSPGKGTYAATDKTRTPRFLWFVVCGFIHLFLEGYFAFNHRTIAGQDFVLAELWKEYAYSDSRYMSADSFVVIMESVTGYIWGPLSFLSAYLIYSSSPASPILEFLVSTGQLYGDVLYYATTLFEGAPHCSTSPFHFWFYFVFLNAFWIVIPLSIMALSAKRVTNAVRQVEGAGVAAGKRKKAL